MRRRLAAALLLVLPLAAARAQDAAGRLEIAGQVAQPASHSIEALAALPTVEFQGAREGGRSSALVGQLLWPIIAGAGLVDGLARGVHLQHVFYARGADGYAVAVATGEIDPQFEGKPVVIAYKQDGFLFARPRLVVPGDRRPGRAVRDLVAIDVR